MPQNRPTAPDIVTAVLVAHDGARWLPETLEALHGQTRPADRIVAADNGSRDRGPAILEESLGAERIITLPRTTGYGEAIVNALRLPAASSAVAVPAEAGDPAPVEWIWLLHDDSAPAPYTLANLLETAARDQFARVIGPKVRDWHHNRELLEAGVTIDRAGRRETGLEPHELDQGQRDGDREVLAVGSAGMLIRRDVWDELGGFDPRIALFRDDIDFCWRAGGAGYKVLLTTTGVVYHAEAGSRRRRRIATGGRHPQRVDRQNALYVLFANLPSGALFVSMVRGLFGSVLRTLLFLLAKQPGSAIDELAAVVSTYGRPLRLIAARRERAKNRRRSYSAIRPFMARGLAAGRLAAMFGSVFGGGAGPMDSAGRHHAGTFGEEEDENAELLSDTRGPIRRALTNPGVLLFLALAVITVVAERALLFGGPLGGGALVPVTGGASDLWRQYTESYHQAGLGSADAAAPATAIVAFVATILGGSVSAAIGLLLLGCVPFAGLVVYFATRRILPYRPARVWLAASYALLPVATGAIAAGRLGTAVAIVVIPVVGVFFAGMLSRPGARARRAAWAAGLLLAVAMAFVPLVWPLSVIVGGLVAVAFGGQSAEARGAANDEERRAAENGLRINVGIVVLTPPILLGPWAWALFAHPPRFLLETGLHRAGLSDPALSAESLLLLSPGGPGMPPIWMTAGFLIAGVIALVLPRNRVLVAAGWGVTLFGLLVAILVSRASPAAPTGGPGVAAWPGVALVVAAGGLLMTAAIAAGPVWGLVRKGGPLRAVGLAVVVIACSSPVLTAASWVWRGADDPLSRHPAVVMPPAVSALSGNRTATLVVRPENGAVTYAVLRGRVPYFGEDQLHPPDAARTRLDALVSGLMSGRGGDDGHALAQYGIRFVLVPAPAIRASSHRLDGVPGMTRMTLTSEYAVWRVTGPTARVWIEGPDGSVTAVPHHPSATLPAGPTGRTLDTAEPYDTGWSATLNGHDLKPVELHGWAQGFRLPASGGRFTLARGSFPHDAWLWIQGLGLVVLIVLALPGARRDTDDEQTRSARAIARAKRKRQRQHQPRRARGHRKVEAPEDAAPGGPKEPETATAKEPEAPARSEPATMAEEPEAAVRQEPALPARPEPLAPPGPPAAPEGPPATTVNAFQAPRPGRYDAGDEPGAESVRESDADPVRESGRDAVREPGAEAVRGTGTPPEGLPGAPAETGPWAAGMRPEPGRPGEADRAGSAGEADRAGSAETVPEPDPDGWRPRPETAQERPEAPGPGGPSDRMGRYGRYGRYEAGRSGLGSYVQEPDWSGNGGTDRPRPDPLAGTPLSREIPVNTSETPTPLAGGHPYGQEYPAGAGGPAGEAAGAGVPYGSGELSVPGVPAGDVVGPGVSAGGSAEASMTYGGGESAVHGVSAGEDAGAGMSVVPETPGEGFAGAEMSYGVEEPAGVEVPAGESDGSAEPEVVEPEASVEEPAGTGPSWFEEEGRTEFGDEPPAVRDESDEMVSDDADEEPSRDAPADDEHAGRPR